MASKRKPTLTPAQKRDSAAIASRNKASVQRQTTARATAQSVARDVGRHGPRRAAPTTSMRRITPGPGTSGGTKKSTGAGINVSLPLPKPNFPTRQEYSGNPLKPKPSKGRGR